MKTKRNQVAIALVCVATVCVGASKAYNAYRMTKNVDALLLENAIALSQREYIENCVRKEGECTVDVGVKGSIKLLGGTILKAGADGTVSFDGQVTCSSGGDTYCAPVECVDLYTAIFQ